MRRIKKAVKIFGLFLCGFIVFCMFYLAFARESCEITVSSAVLKEQNTPALQPKSEEEKKLGELQSSAAQSRSASKLYTSTCSACHGKNGEGRFDDKGEVIFPAIAKKPPEFIIKRVHDYKSGKIPNPLMAALLKNIKDEDLKALSDEISKF
ncbi:MAG: c-type cytochrome [Campylobacteraceae bacterium]|jgi:cytochrome c553|nr:c-type cytochrome [Campylobacteraceae bacterium]